MINTYRFLYFFVYKDNTATTAMPDNNATTIKRRLASAGFPPDWAPLSVVCVENVVMSAVVCVEDVVVSAVVWVSDIVLSAIVCVEDVVYGVVCLDDVVMSAVVCVEDVVVFIVVRTVEVVSAVFWRVYVASAVV
jgi:hypothetical protein